MGSPKQPPTDPLDSLRSGSPASATATNVGGVAFIDYRGKIGPDRQFAHEGEQILTFKDREPVVLSPGLNLIDPATWADIRSRSSVAAMLADGRLFETDESLAPYSSVGALRDLVERTQSGDALDLLLRREMAKPQAGPIGQRRSQDLVDLLNRKVQAALRRGVLDLTGITTDASRHARILTKKAV